MATTSPFKVLPIPNKGYGCVATRRIASGELIHAEGPMMRIPVPSHALTDTHMQNALASLTPTDQARVLALHEGTHRTDLTSTMMRIFKANTFGNGSACWLHPILSRFNHSCLPNASTAQSEGDEVHLIAEREIDEGEEICFSYNQAIYEITTAKQRAGLFRKQYGFECDCKACRGGVSDSRRLLIKALKERLHGLETADFAVLEDEEADVGEEDLWIKEVPPVKEPSAQQKVAYNLLLASLQEAECSPAANIAVNYFNAAQAMLDQMMEMKNVVILSWAVNVQLYMEKAIEAIERVRSPFDEESQTLRAAWRAMQARPCLKVALAFLDGSLERKVDQMMTVDDEEPFAIQVTKNGDLKLLCESEYNGLFETMDDISVASQEDEEPRAIEKFRSHIAGHGVYKILGAALTCAAPIAAYFMMR